MNKKLIELLKFSLVLLIRSEVLHSSKVLEFPTLIFEAAVKRSDLKPGRFQVASERAWEGLN